jgi:hypothetical protein
MRLHVFVKCVIAAVIYGACVNATAEGNCPPGYYQTGGRDFVGCAPLPGAAGAVAPDPGPSWSTRWGAIATDGKSGIFAGISASTSKRKAEKDALKQCRANGGKQCKISLAFNNQCAAIAWGDSAYSTVSSPTVEEASQKAIARCHGNTQNCEIYYSACSYPQRIR